MRVLGLDISSQSTGWAVLEDGQLDKSCHHYGLIKMKHKTHGERLAYFDNELHTIIVSYDVDMVAIEDVWAGKFILPSLILSRYRGIAEKVCWERFKTEPLVRTATDFRKLLGLKYETNLLPGKKEKLATGKDSKELTFELMCKVFDLKLDFEKDNDKTDALAVSLAAYLLGTDFGQAVDAETASKKASKKAKKAAARSKRKR